MSNFKQYGFMKKHIDSTVKVGKIKEVSGHIYTLDGYNLITSVNVKNIEFIQKDDRVIVYDSHGRVIMNISIYDMDGWAAKNYDNGVEEHIFSIKDKGVKYKMFVRGCVIGEAAC